MQHQLQMKTKKNPKTYISQWGKETVSLNDFYYSISLANLQKAGHSYGRSSGWKWRQSNVNNSGNKKETT